LAGPCDAIFNYVKPKIDRGVDYFFFRFFVFFTFAFAFLFFAIAALLA
jgi:hypothetical protein